MSRSGATLGSVPLEEGIGPCLGHHYRAPIDPGALERGDELTIELETPPQMARHEGYETAFLEAKSVQFGLEDF